jgi:enoyl-CoA hydratase/carnithine racemase
VDVEVVDGVSTVRFDHPPVNALDLNLLDHVVETMRGVDGPVVITGAGRFMTSLSAAFLAVFDHPAPAVAAINGHAIAGTSAQCFRWPHSRHRPPWTPGTVDVATAAALGWVDEVVAPDELLPAGDRARP